MINKSKLEAQFLKQQKHLANQNIQIARLYFIKSIHFVHSKFNKFFYTKVTA